MSAPIQLRMGGYGPPTTSFSRALKFIGDRLTAELGQAVEFKYVWNIMTWDIAPRTFYGSSSTAC